MMNSVYYIFLVIIIISFITGIIITFVDNFRGEVFEGDFGTRRRGPSDKTTKIVPIRTNTLEMQPVSSVANNTVPYLPIDPSNNFVPPIVYENTTVLPSLGSGTVSAQSSFNTEPQIISSQPVTPQVVTPQVVAPQPVTPQVVAPQPVVTPAQSFSAPTVQPVSNVQPLQSNPQPMITSVQPITNQNLQINTVNDVNGGYFNAPVLVPMSMDDGSI